MIKLLLFFCIFHIIRCSCPEGFELVSNGECRGFYGTVDLNWDQRAINTASDKCYELGAVPVSIHNDEQQAYWKARGWLLIGIHCNPVGSPWHWPDGSYVNYRPSAGYNKALDKNCKAGCSWDILDTGEWQMICTGQYYTSDIYCSTQLEQPAPGGDGCEGFEDDSDDHMCYQIGETAENFQDARKICTSFGAELASIHNQKENAFIRRMSVSKGAVNGVFIGANSSTNGKDFSWVDGSKWDYNNFYPGFPITGYGDCLTMDTQSTSGEWANVPCSSKQAVACQRKQHYTSSTCSSGPWNEGDLIYTPGFPVSASTPCDYILSVATGKRVQVEILLLEANSCCDHLIINENYVGGFVIANLTGEVNDKKYTTTSSNFMRVSWQPNGGKNVRGMMMTFKAV